MWLRALLIVAWRGPGKALLLASAAGWVVMAALVTGDRLSLPASSSRHGGHLAAGATSIASPEPRPVSSPSPTAGSRPPHPGSRREGSVLDGVAGFTAFWLAMVAAMSPPLLLRETGRLWRTSLRRRRYLTIGSFLWGYVTVWLLTGAVLSSVIGWVTVSSWRLGVAVALLAVWQCSPWRQRCVNACHRPATLRLFGTAAQRDALQYGISTGCYCAAACGSFMLLVLLATDFHLVLMAIAVAVSVVDRYSPARRPRWRLPLPGGESIAYGGFVETPGFKTVSSVSPTGVHGKGQVKRMRVIACFIVVLMGALVTEAQEPLAFVRAIELPRVEGRIDHLTIDRAEQRLFVAALGNNSVEVLDLRSGSDTRSIPGFHEPQGIGQPLDGNLVGVANGGTGDLVLIGRTDLRVDKTVSLGDDADNVRFDRLTRQFFVGYGSGALAAIAEDGRRIGEVKLGGHPESFQLETGSPSIFVNVPDARQIAVVDRRAMRVQATWPITTASANYPMALDEAGHRLFVGCRRPAVVLVVDTDTGKVQSSVQIAGDTDDMFYDVKRQRLYVIGGDGFVDVLRRSDRDHLERTARVATAAGARTGLFVPEADRLYVAVPHRGRQRAEIRVFDAR
jgi:predicted metal-binding membrane protein